MIPQRDGLKKIIESIKSNYFDFKKLITLTLSILFVVAPITYAQSGWYGLFWGTSVSLLNGLFFRNAFQGLITGLIAGLVPTIQYSFTEITLVGFLMPFLIGFGRTVTQESEIDSRNLFLSSIIGLILGFIIGITLFFSQNISLLSVFFVSLISAIGIIVGVIAGFWLRPKILLYSNILLYLREMAVYLVFFSVGYFAVALLFAGWFWSIWKIYPNSFNNVSSNANFLEFFYFSMVTIVTLGYGDITPKSDLARMLIVFEAVLGIGWITVIFAAVMSHLQPLFSDINNSERKKQLVKIQEEVDAKTSPIYTIMLSDTEDDGRGIYATIRNDYAKNKNDKSVSKKVYGFRIWGIRIRQDIREEGFETAKEAEQAAIETYEDLNKNE